MWSGCRLRLSFMGHHTPVQQKVELASSSQQEPGVGMRSAASRRWRWWCGENGPISNGRLCKPSAPQQTRRGRVEEEEKQFTVVDRLNKPDSAKVMTWLCLTACSGVGYSALVWLLDTLSTSGGVVVLYASLFPSHFQWMLNLHSGFEVKHFKGINKGVFSVDFGWIENLGTWVQLTWTQIQIFFWSFETAVLSIPTLIIFL